MKTAIEIVPIIISCHSIRCQWFHLTSDSRPKHYCAPAPALNGEVCEDGTNCEDGIADSGEGLLQEAVESYVGEDDRRVVDQDVNTCAKR